MKVIGVHDYQQLGLSLLALHMQYFANSYFEFHLSFFCRVTQYCQIFVQLFKGSFNSSCPG